ncbi:hypothetical protein ABMA28_010360 [Loxostege sticticalis]|uniref:Endonuclease/exonuclease/phosphatase domain-containing protein n=1 Tax=Loxostege sticticalis TaxID=481309 RepID=A0ABD0SB92_LOXSC
MRQNRSKETIRARASPISDGTSKDVTSNARASPPSDGKKKQQIMGPICQMRIATWNIGSMTGRSTELSAVLERRFIDVCCVQETKWKGAKSRQIGKGYKLVYNGITNTRNGVGIILSRHFSDKIVEINRISDRIISVKIALDRQPCLNIVSVYAPQVNCSEAEKTDIWEDLHALVTAIPSKEQKLICGDLNGHVGQRADDYKEFHEQTNKRFGWSSLTLRKRLTESQGR